MNSCSSCALMSTQGCASTRRSLQAHEDDEEECRLAGEALLGPHLLKGPWAVRRMGIRLTVAQLLQASLAKQGPHTCPICGRDLEIFPLKTKTKPAKVYWDKKMLRREQYFHFH